MDEVKTVHSCRERWNEKNNASFQVQEFPEIYIWIFPIRNFLWPVERQRGLYIRRKWNKVGFMIFYAFQLENTHVNNILFRG